MDMVTMTSWRTMTVLDTPLGKARNELGMVMMGMVPQISVVICLSRNTMKHFNQERLPGEGTASTFV
jgi:hypothetical protein